MGLVDKIESAAPGTEAKIRINCDDGTITAGWWKDQKNLLPTADSTKNYKFSLTKEQDSRSRQVYYTIRNVDYGYTGLQEIKDDDNNVYDVREVPKQGFDFDKARFYRAADAIQAGYDWLKDRERARIVDVGSKSYAQLF